MVRDEIEPPVPVFVREPRQLSAVIDRTLADVQWFQRGGAFQSVVRSQTCLADACEMRRERIEIDPRSGGESAKNFFRLGETGLKAALSAFHRLHAGGIVEHERDVDRARGKA